MSCKKVKTTKYLTRKSPAYHAAACAGETKLGNDKEEWTSVADKRGVYTWKKTMKAAQGNLFALYTFSPDKAGESWSYGDLPSGWWWVGSGGGSAGFEQDEQFSGPKSGQTKMRKFLETYFAGLKKKGILTHYAIRNSYPKMSGGAYNLKTLPKEFRDPQYGNNPNYYLAFEKDNVGMFDEKNDTFYRTGRHITGLGSRWRNPNATFVVTDKNKHKFKIHSKNLEIMQSWPELGIAEIQYKGANKLTRKNYPM